MFVIHSLKINRFAPVIVKPARELVGQAPKSVPQYPSNTLSNIGYAVNVLGSKLQTLELGQIIDAAADKAAHGDNPAHKELNIDPSKL